MTKRKVAWEKPKLKTQQKTVTKRYALGCNKYVEIVVECGSCYRWYHYKCEGTTEKEIKKLYPKEPHYICKREKTQSQ